MQGCPQETFEAQWVDVVWGELVTTSIFWVSRRYAERAQGEC